MKEQDLIKQLKGFDKGTKLVLRLQKKFCKLKQSPRELHDTLCTALPEKGMTKTNFDPSIFIIKERTIIIAPFVNNLESVYTDEKEQMAIFHHLESKFQMTV